MRLRIIVTFLAGCCSGSPGYTQIYVRATNVRVKVTGESDYGAAHP